MANEGKIASRILSRHLVVNEEDDEKVENELEKKDDLNEENSSLKIPLIKSDDDTSGQDEIVENSEPEVLVEDKINQTNEEVKEIPLIITVENEYTGNDKVTDEESEVRDEEKDREVTRDNKAVEDKAIESSNLEIKFEDNIITEINVDYNNVFDDIQSIKQVSTNSTPPPSVKVLDDFELYEQSLKKQSEEEQEKPVVIQNFEDIALKELEQKINEGIKMSAHKEDRGALNMSEEEKLNISFEKSEDDQGELIVLDFGNNNSNEDEQAHTDEQKKEDVQELNFDNIFIDYHTDSAKPEKKMEDESSINDDVPEEIKLDDIHEETQEQELVLDVEPAEKPLALTHSEEQDEIKFSFDTMQEAGDAQSQNDDIKLNFEDTQKVDDIQIQNDEIKLSFEEPVSENEADDSNNEIVFESVNDSETQEEEVLTDGQIVDEIPEHHDESINVLDELKGNFSFIEQLDEEMTVFLENNIEIISKERINVYLSDKEFDLNSYATWICGKLSDEKVQDVYNKVRGIEAQYLFENFIQLFDIENFERSKVSVDGKEVLNTFELNDEILVDMYVSQNKCERFELERGEYSVVVCDKVELNVDEYREKIINSKLNADNVLIAVLDGIIVDEQAVNMALRYGIKIIKMDSKLSAVNKNLQELKNKIIR